MPALRHFYVVRHSCGAVPKSIKVRPGTYDTCILTASLVAPPRPVCCCAYYPAYSSAQATVCFDVCELLLLYAPVDVQRTGESEQQEHVFCSPERTRVGNRPSTLPQNGDGSLSQVRDGALFFVFSDSFGYVFRTASCPVSWVRWGPVKL